MKKLFTFAAAMLFVASLALQAQPYTVTFNVDMSVKAAEGSFSIGDSVFVRGSFNGWGTTDMMDDTDGDSVYTLAVGGFNANDTVYYKFFHTPDVWESDPNRELIVTGDVSVTDFFDRDSVVNTTTYTVTFQVDMNVKQQEGLFDATANNVYVRGSFNGWGTDNMMDDSDGDLVYETSVSGLQGSVDFKFFYDNPDTWESDPNRNLNVDSDITFKDFFDRDSVVTLETYTVTFQVDMSVKDAEGTFDKTASNVSVRGSFNGWGETAMDDSDGDLLYEAVVADVQAGTQAFKFFYNNPDTWENDPNREIDVTGDMTFRDFFDRDSVIDITGDGNVLFKIDMTVMEEIGIFDATTDSVQVRGGFNGWSDSDPARSKMSQNPLIPSVWTLNVPFSSQPIDEELQYKYYVALANPGIWTDGWERPNSQGGGNRGVLFKGETAQEVSDMWYDDINPDWVIEAGQSIDVTFSVDMSPAMDDNLQAVPFDPATDTLYWIGEQPSFVRTQGWEDTDNMKVLMLTDPDGDNIYTGTLTVNGPSFNSFEYRYAYVSAADGGNFIHEPAGFGDFAYRVRYCAMTGARSFVQPYSTPTDVWTNQEDKSDQWEDGPVTGVRETDAIVNKFELQQNYPNPFNPTTTIRFSVPAKGMVSLKVYNVLGQLVANLVNQELKAGSYEVDFDGFALSSGIYLYKLSTGNYEATKKMMLLK